MGDERGGSYHPGVAEVETASEIPSGTEDRFANVEALLCLLLLNYLHLLDFLIGHLCLRYHSSVKQLCTFTLCY